MHEKMRQLVDRVRHDRKLAVMGVLVLVAMLLWGRLLLLDNVPRTATADPTAEAEGSQAQPEPVPTVSTQRRGAPVPVHLAERLPRDLFNFASPELAWAGPKNRDGGPNNERSTPDRSDEQLRSAAVRAAARRLELRSVVMSELPFAVIDGRVLRVGEEVEGFTLLEIAERHVLLERNGVIVRLKM